MTIKNYKMNFGAKKGMNREQRRKYDRQVKNDRMASICPECGHKSRFHTHARGEKDTVLLCERCGAIVREGEELTRMMPPGIYLSIPLDILDQALLAEATRIEEENNEQIDPSMPVEAEGSVT